MFQVTDPSPFFFDQDGALVAYPESQQGLKQVDDTLQETIELHVFESEAAATAFAEGIVRMLDLAGMEEGPRLDPGTFPLVGTRWPAVFVRYPAPSADDIGIVLVNHD